MSSPKTAPLLSVRNLSTGYGKRQVLFDVSLDVIPGEILLITGGNGSGKSTLLKAIYGLLAPWNSDAEIIFRPVPEGPAISTLQPVFNLQNGLGYLPQKNAVFDNLSVEDNLRLAGHTLSHGKEFTTRRSEVLVFLPALKPILLRKPEKMSGGERQMVALAMVLLHRPKLLLLDEPTAGLDLAHRHEIETVLEQLSLNHSVALLWIEHGVATTSLRTKRLLRLNRGKIASAALSVPSVRTPGKFSTGASAST
jgi:branched-chain amino acid transport system ATP-binding protein